MSGVTKKIRARKRESFIEDAKLLPGDMVSSSREDGFLTFDDLRGYDRSPSSAYLGVRFYDWAVVLGYVSGSILVMVPRGDLRWLTKDSFLYDQLVVVHRAGGKT